MSMMWRAGRPFWTSAMRDLEDQLRRSTGHSRPCMTGCGRERMLGSLVNPVCRQCEREAEEATP